MQLFFMRILVFEGKNTSEKNNKSACNIVVHLYVVYLLRSGK